jgi:hypothetical protein
LGFVDPLVLTPAKPVTRSEIPENAPDDV